MKLSHTNINSNNYAWSIIIYLSEIIGFFQSNIFFIQVHTDSSSKSGETSAVTVRSLCFSDSGKISGGKKRQKANQFFLKKHLASFLKIIQFQQHQVSKFHLYTHQCKEQNSNVHDFANYHKNFTILLDFYRQPKLGSHSEFLNYVWKRI